MGGLTSQPLVEGGAETGAEAEEREEKKEEEEEEEEEEGPSTARPCKMAVAAARVSSGPAIVP